MLSAPTLDALFDGSSDANEENAGPDTGVAAPAADIAQPLPGQIGLSDEDVVVGAFQRMLSEAESEGHVQFSDNESKQDDVERVDTSPPAVHVRADDVNVLQEDEHSDDFECMESSTSDDGGDDCEEDDVSLGKRVVFRRPAKFGARKKTRRELLREEEDDADNEGETAYVANV
ncbi:hypothetical protein PInf_021627 [Phytophthora infestans]|nr:hypothetical protein PInf_021627 [Phytophthora infestans]